MTKTILIVDDNKNLRNLLNKFLTQEGFRVVTADNGQNALYAARYEKPDLILLDIMMPEMDGYEFIRAFRKEKDTPVILLTAKLEESDKVAGLELGADDYITKPFGMKELLARIRAVLRRTQIDVQNEEILRVGNVTLDKNSHQIDIEGKNIRLTPTEFDLLAALMSSPGRVFSRADLLEHLQGNAWDGAERTINVHITNLRSKIETDSANPQYIETVFGVGYRFLPQHPIKG